MARDDVPVYLVEAYPPRRIGIAGVPENRKCILIDANIVRKVSSYFTGYQSYDFDSQGNPLYLGDYPFYFYVMIFVLLHEAGHISMLYFDDDASTDDVHRFLCRKYISVEEELQGSKRGNVHCDRSKTIELAADLFAATAIRSGGVNSTNRIRYESSLRTQQALHILGMSIIFDFAERNEKQNNIRQQGEYFDKGRSHPNIELRILATLAMIDPSMEQSLRSYLRSRRGDIEPYISLEYSKMQSINL